MKWLKRSSCSITSKLLNLFVIACYFDTVKIGLFLISPKYLWDYFKIKSPVVMPGFYTLFGWYLVILVKRFNELFFMVDIVRLEDNTTGKLFIVVLFTTDCVSQFYGFCVGVSSEFQPATHISGIAVNVVIYFFS